MKPYRKAANDIAEQLKGEMTTQRRKALESMYRKMDRFAKAMEENDIEALLDLSEERLGDRKEK